MFDLLKLRLPLSYFVVAPTFASAQSTKPTARVKLRRCEASFCRIGGGALLADAAANGAPARGLPSPLHLALRAVLRVVRNFIFPAGALLIVAPGASPCKPMLALVLDYNAGAHGVDDGNVSGVDGSDAKSIRMLFVVVDRLRIARKQSEVRGRVADLGKVFGFE